MNHRVRLINESSVTMTSLTVVSIQILTLKECYIVIPEFSNSLYSLFLIIIHDISANIITIMLDSLSLQHNKKCPTLNLWYGEVYLQNTTLKKKKKSTKQRIVRFV